MAYSDGGGSRVSTESQRGVESVVESVRVESIVTDLTSLVPLYRPVFIRVYL